MPLNPIGYGLASFGNSIGSALAQNKHESKLQGLISDYQGGSEDALLELAGVDPRIAELIYRQQNDGYEREQEQIMKRARDAGIMASQALEIGEDPKAIRAFLTQQANLTDDEELKAEIVDAINMDDIGMMNDLRLAVKQYAGIPRPGQDRAQYGAQVTVKDSKGNLYFSTQERDPSTKEVKTVLSPVGNAPEQPVGQVQVVGQYGLTASEKVDQIGDEATAGERAKENEKQRQAYIEQGNVARSMISRTKKLIELNNLISTGKTAKARKYFGDLFGVTDPDLGQFNAMAGKLVLDNIRSLGANPTEGERAFLLEISPSLEQGGAVNEAILNDMLEIQNRQVNRARWFARNPGKTIEEYFLLTDEEEFNPSSQSGNSQDEQAPAPQGVSDDEWRVIMSDPELRKAFGY